MHHGGKALSAFKGRIQGDLKANYKMQYGGAYNPYLQPQKKQAAGRREEREDSGEKGEEAVKTSPTNKKTKKILAKSPATSKETFIMTRTKQMIASYHNTAQSQMAGLAQRLSLSPSAKKV